LETRVISHFSEGTGTFALADECGACGFVASAHRELNQENIAWLRRFLTDCFSAARNEESGGDDRGVLVRFFQSVHAGLFGGKQGAAQEIGEVSIVAACVMGDIIEIAGAGRCAAYRVTAGEARRMFSTDEDGAEQSGLGTSLKVSMEMVKRSFSEDAVYVLTSSRVESGEDWTGRLIRAARSAAANTLECSAVLFGEGGGSFAMVASEAAVEAFAAAETRAEATGVTWYTALREEIRKGASVLFREDRREERQARVPDGVSGAEPEPEAVAGRVREEAGEGPGADVHATTEEVPEGAPEEFGKAAFGAAPEEGSEVAPVVTEEPPAVPQFLEGAPLMEPMPVKERRRTITVPVRALGFVIAAIAVSVAAYALWSGHGRVLRLFSSTGARDEKAAASNEKSASGALILGSIPSGAEVIIDNRLMASRTPVQTVAVSPGTHEVKLRLGELGEWAGSVSLQPGDTASVNIAFIGGISVRSGTKEGLSVFLDGQLRGYTPCLLESIPAGLHVVKVEGEGFSPWQEEVVVSYGGISEVEVKPGKLPATGQVRVTSRVMTEEGFEDAGGAPVFVDGKRAGTTPAKIDSKPGLHSIKVGGLEGHSASVFVIDVRPGGKHFIRAEFGGGEPIVIDCSETRAPGGELMVYASLVNKREAILSDISLYLEKSGGTQVRWQPMVLVPGSRGVYAAVIPESILSGEGVLKYFARARTSEGIEYYSEVRTLSQR